MTLPVAFRRRVHHDLAAAFDWYEAQRPGFGDEFLRAALAVFASITHHPEMFGLIDPEVRRAIVARFPFAVFYTIEPERVVVLRVLHTARNPSLWPRRRKAP
jgi:plasmid stabilization system protein ParE